LYPRTTCEDLKETKATMAITDGIIRQNTTNQSYVRGMDYYRSGSVRNLVLRDSTLHSQVSSGCGKPYRVTVMLRGGNAVSTARCTCPYSQEGWCKHIVATLLKHVKEPYSVQHRSTLEEMLSTLNLAQALGVIRDMVGAQPELIQIVDRRVTGEDEFEENSGESDY
jgi:uncharacterized Zn finger protein